MTQCYHNLGLDAVAWEKGIAAAAVLPHTVQVTTHSSPECGQPFPLLGWLRAISVAI